MSLLETFVNIKKKYPDTLILFRCGDFYETYADDAVIASQILGITLTKRSSGMGKKEDSTPMAGFPRHALESYLPKLIRVGKRVAFYGPLG